MMEKEVESWLGKQIRHLGGLWLKFVSPGHVGVPDRILIWKGQVEFVEMKTETGVLSPVQKGLFRAICAAGKPVHVIYGKEGAERFLEAIKERAHFIVSYNYPDIYVWR